MTRPTLIVFLRAPAIGRGKTRLAREIGLVAAWRFARTQAEQTLRRLADPRWRLVVRVTPDIAAHGGWEPQGAGDLGHRLERAIRAHARGPVAVVGTDCPDLTPARVARTFAAARRTGAAIGQAEDGGYWILALSARRARRVALDGVRWSTAHACDDTVRALGGDVVRLETLIDVDDLKSLRTWRASRKARARRWPG